MLKHLDSIDDWYKLFKSQGHFFIFKHSNMCNISAEARKRVLDNIDNLPTDVYEVIVQEDREISDQIAKSLKVKHESPQLIEFKHYGVVEHTSHGSILPN